MTDMAKTSFIHSRQFRYVSVSLLYMGLSFRFSLCGLMIELCQFIIS